MQSPLPHRNGADVERLRSALLNCLSDGRARTAVELARVAGGLCSDAESQLAELLAARAVHIAAQGRHTYYALGTKADEPVRAQACAAQGSEFKPSTPVGLRAARTCYGHLAGALGVALCDRMLARGWLAATDAGADAYRVTPAGASAFAELDIDTTALRDRSRRYAYPCFDWSERRPHLGGVLGVAVCEAAARRRWITREAGSRRVVLTSAGRQGFATWLDATF